MIGAIISATVEGAPLIEGPVRPVPIVMIQVLGEDSFEIAPAEDEEPVQLLIKASAVPVLKLSYGSRRQTTTA